MMRASITGLLLLAVAGGPVAAQSMLKPNPADTSLPRRKIVTVLNAADCPKQTDPDEIIVCVVIKDDPYRIPPTLRDDAKPLAPNTANRKALLGDDAGGAGGGIGSCSAVGPGGGTGCNQALQDQYRAGRKRGDIPQSVLPQITPTIPPN